MVKKKQHTNGITWVNEIFVDGFHYVFHFVFKLKNWDFDQVNFKLFLGVLLIM
jgi:hypothetical protein